MGVLRILLAVCVYCEHALPLGNLRWLTGYLAVEIFFVISGFYMQLVLAGKYSKAALGPSWISQFYKARYFRLLPVYLMGVGLVIGSDPLRASSSLLSNWSQIWALPNIAANLIYKVFLAFTNVAILGQDLTMFLALDNGQIHWSPTFWKSELPLWQGLALPQAWSLGVELTFYLCAPFLLNLRSRWLALIVVVSLGIKGYVLQAFQIEDPWLNRFFPFEVGYFLLGALAYRYRKTMGRWLPDQIGKYAVFPLVVGLVTTLMPGSLATFLYPMTMAVLLPAIFRVTAANKIDRWIGELSYPFYVLHLFALSIAASFGRLLKQGEVSVAWIGLALTLGLSVAAWLLEARYIEPWRARFAERPSRAK